VSIDIGQVFERSGAMVLRRARSLLRNPDAARDVVQEVFLTLHREVRHVEPAKIDAWLYRVTTHTCFHLMRDARNRQRLLDERGEVLLSDGPVRPDGWSAVRQTLNRLPDEVAAAAVYFHMDGMTYDEIAQVMQCSRRHVGHLLESLKAHVDSERRQA
jgi:RNA polymerase sigma factor (sigma-70 family)